MFAYEGQKGPILSFYADEVRDRLSPGNKDYQWVVYSADSDPIERSTVFELTENETTSDQKTELVWKDIPDYGNPEDRQHDLIVRLKEGDLPHYDFNVTICLLNVPNEPPVFDVPEVELSRKENNANEYLYTLLAKDPDANDTKVIAPHLMQKSSTKFGRKKDADRFKINSTTGELSFDFSSGFFLNYENPFDHNQDRIFEVEIEAIKLVGTETFNSEPFLLKVRIENAPEAPEFKPLTNAFPDANFSIVEQNRSKTFTVEALSEDPSFPVTEVSLSSNNSDNDNKYFQSVSSNSNNSLTFEFENPPDYESPLDSDGDNDYVVSIEAQCDGNHHY